MSAVNHLHQPTKLACPAWHEARARHPHGSRIQGRKQATGIHSALWSSNWVSSAHETTAETLPPDRKSTRLTPVTNAHLVCRRLLEKKKPKTIHNNNNLNQP